MNHEVEKFYSITSLLVHIHECEAGLDSHLVFCDSAYIEVVSIFQFLNLSSSS